MSFSNILFSIPVNWNRGSVRRGGWPQWPQFPKQPNRRNVISPLNKWHEKTFNSPEHQKVRDRGRSSGSKDCSTCKHLRLRPLHFGCEAVNCQLFIGFILCLDLSFNFVIFTQPGASLVDKLVRSTENGVNPTQSRLQLRHTVDWWSKWAKPYMFSFSQALFQSHSWVLEWQQLTINIFLKSYPNLQRPSTESDHWSPRVHYQLAAALQSFRQNVIFSPLARDPGTFFMQTKCPFNDLRHCSKGSTCQFNLCGLPNISQNLMGFCVLDIFEYLPTINFH